MATQPDPSPDTIDPGAPQELPPTENPAEAPMHEPPGFEPPQPDIIEPSPAPNDTSVPD